MMLSVTETRERSAYDSDAAPPVAADLARARLADAMIRTGEGDHAGFRDVYTLTSAKLYGICLRVCGDSSAAQDVLHDVYLTVWKNAATWQPSGASPITWLATIARNRSIDWRRKRGRRAFAPLDDAVAVIDPAPSPEMTAGARRETCSINAHLDRLEPRQADAIRAAFFGGLSYSELAMREGVPLGTVKSRIRRGLARLRDDFDGVGR